MKSFQSVLPGFLIALAIASLATALESVLPGHYVSASVMAIFIGTLANVFLRDHDFLVKGLEFASKKLLKLAIILLGASLNIATIISVGQTSLIVMLFTLFTCFVSAFFLGRLFGLDWKLTSLISSGAAICGGSAIVSVAPVIKAEDRDVAYALSVIFLFDMLMIVLLPAMGRTLGLTDSGYGLWAGTAVHDTSSVVAAGYALGEAAGDFATMVKLTRTLFIIPVVVGYSALSMMVEKRELESGGEHSVHHKNKVNWIKIFPWFILGFLLMTGLRSAGVIQPELARLLKKISKFMMVVALAEVGLRTDFREIKKLGVKPLTHGFLVSVLVVTASFVVSSFLGLLR